MEYGFLVRPDELDLRFRSPTGRRELAFTAATDSFEAWRTAARRKLVDLLGMSPSPSHAGVTELRRITTEGVRISAFVMRVDDTLTLPAYLLHPAGGDPAASGSAVVALHGHGDVAACLGEVGADRDYHHQFALELARAGHTVLCPELRGFGALADLAAGLEGRSLNYWRWGEHMTYPLLTDAFLNGRTMLGDTVEDLLRWENWLASALSVTELDVAGISYGGDLACTYPAFSGRVRSIFASGTLGSFDAIFGRCGNAPAPCIPGVSRWFDRADIAGLSAPTPILLHYGERDTPESGNGSAAYNETVPQAVDRLRAIYAAAGAPDAVSLEVSPGLGHEMDVALLLDFVAGRRGDR